MNASLLNFCERLAVNVGIEKPASVYGSSDRTWQEALEFANETGRELLRRFDWSDLYEETPIVGTGSDTTHTLPAGFDRLAKGISVKSGTTPLRPLTQREWGGLTAVQGTPRYYLLDGSTIKFWPYLASAEVVTVGYIKDQFCTGGASFLADNDTVVFPDDVFGLGLIVRWRRQKGMPYADFEAEYEAMLQDRAQFDRNARV